MARPGEAEAVATMVAKIAERKIAAYDFMRSLWTWDPATIHHTGYKTREEGIVATFKRAEQEIDKIQREFIRKFPD